MRVLLIEDDSATAQSIELMLKSENFNIYTTDLGEEGVDLGKLYDYDIILLDLNLPDMSGVDILRRIKSHPILKAAPVVVLTTTDDKTEINRCYELGCSVDVTKPIDYDSFAEAIRRLGLFLQVVRAAEVDAS